MKRIKLYTLLSSCIISMSAAALPTSYWNQAGNAGREPMPSQLQYIAAQGMDVENVGTGMWASHPKVKKTNAAASTIKLTITTDKDSANIISSDNVSIYNTDYYDYTSARGDGTVTFTVPEGTYDVLYWYLDKTERINYLVAREQVKVSHDSTLHFSPYEATVHLKFRSYSPDGKPWVLDRYDDDWNIIRGNVTGVFIGTYLCCKGINDRLAGRYTSSNIQLNSDYNNFTDFVVNPVSDRYFFLQDRNIIDNKFDMYVDCFKLIGTKKDSISSQYSDYRAMSEEIKVAHTNTDKWFAGNENIDMYNGVYQNGISYRQGWKPIDKDEPITYYINADEDESDMGCRFDIVSMWTKSNAVFEGVKDNGDSVIASYPTCTPHMISRAGNKEYRFIIPSNYFLKYCKYDTSKPAIDWTTGHRLYSFGEKQKKGVFGDCTPIMRFDIVYDSVTYLPPYGYYYWDPYYYGRMGEIIGGNQYTMKAEMTFNGEKVDTVSDYKTLYNFSKIWYANGNREKGLFHLKLTSTNDAVDGIGGKNVTETEFDQRKADATPPTVTMLQFRDNSGNVTDRFNKPEEGNFYLSVADFNFDMYNFKETLQKADVAVSYAPTGTSDFKALELSPIEDATTRDVGYSYKGSLKDVATKSASGWFDMQITVTDESGNYQRQTITPAFKIQVLSGIDDVEAEPASGKRAIYNLQGMVVNDMASPGIYIVKEGNKVMKVIK